MTSEEEAFFTCLYSTYYNKIKLYVLSFVRDPNRADEITQDTFHTALEKIDSLIDAEEPIRWLKKTAKNKTFNDFRTQQRQVKRYLSLDDCMGTTNEPSAPGLLEDDYIEQEARDELPSVGETLEKTLTREEAALLNRFVIEHATHAEVSEELGISIWASQKRYQRIMAKLFTAFPKFKK